jgi:Fe-S cluster assembly protein SufD
LADGAAAPASTAEPEWLTERRRRGASLAAELPLPDQKAKGWEFTDLSELDLDAYEPAADGVPSVPEAPGEAIALPLTEAIERHPELVRKHLGSLVATEDPFVARNDADWSPGLFLYVPSGVRLEEAIEVEGVLDGERTALSWRTLIVLDDGAEAEVRERYRSGGDGDEGLFNGVVELVVGPGASLRYVSQQELSVRSWVFATQRAELARDASLEWLALGFGSARGKVRMETKLAGRGSSAKVTGAYAGTGGQHLDYDTTQEHAEPHTTSDLAFRGVLGERATAVWRGMIRVDPGAQQTDAFQESRNLLLSTDAHADAIPGLEIEADDVRCTHAAAVAQVDREQLFYLRARGLGEGEATRLIIDGFLQSLVQRVPEGAIRDELSAALEARLAAILAERAPT